MEKVKAEVIVVDDDEPKAECKPTNIKNKKRKVEKTINTSSNTETLVITQKHEHIKMEKVNAEVIVVDDDEPEAECKPTNIKNKKRKVEKTINTSSNTETLVITQKVRKQKFKCIINLTNICEFREKRKRKVKPSSTKINAKEVVKVKKKMPNAKETVKVKKTSDAKEDVKAKKKVPNAKETVKDKKKIPYAKEVVKVEKILPDCLRKRCKIDVKRKYDNDFARSHKKELERKKLGKSRGRGKTKSVENNKSENINIISSKHKIRRVEPTQRRSHGHSRYLSPISSDSLSDVLSEHDEAIMSYEDISSDSITEIDTLIKRTKDREKKSSVDRFCDYDRHKNISSAFTKTHAKINGSQKSQTNKTCAVIKPVTHRSRYGCIKNNANISLPKADKSYYDNEYVIDMDSTHEPKFMSSPKYEDSIEIPNASASDGDTVLSGEMDIVSFHSQGTLVLDSFYSPSQSTGSRSYSPIMSPAFHYQEGVPENKLSQCVPSPSMTPAFRHLIPNSATEIASLKGNNPYSLPDNPIMPVRLALDVQNYTYIELESNFEQNLKKAKEHVFPKTDLGISTNVSSINFDIKNVKIEAAAVPEILNNETTFESSNSCVNIKIKEEVNEDSFNNIKPNSVLNLSMRTSNDSRDDNLGIKKEE